MIKFFKWSVLIIVCAVLLVLAVGMYKFNYLSGLEGYDVDGNKITQLTDKLPWKNADTLYAAKIGDKIFSSAHNKPNDIFLIGSVTKVFTATLILQMAHEGKINLDDKVSKFIDNPVLGDGVLIKNLLNHTSGIKDGDEIELFKKAYRNQNKTATYADQLDGVRYLTTQEFSYSNVNYILLGGVLEKVSGKSFEDNVSINIIDKLGLKNTCFISISGTCNFKKGYFNFALLNEEEKYTQLDNYIYFSSISGSAGNIASNLADLELFFKSIFENKFYNSDVLRASLMANKYGYGMKGFGNGYIGHVGQALDFASFVAFNPEQQKFIIILVGDASVDMNMAIDYFRSK